MNGLTKLVALGAVVAASSSLASATILTPGGPAETATTIASFNTGIVTGTNGALSARTFTGTYISAVIHDSANPFNSQCGAAGCLTFVFDVSNNASSPNGIEHVSDGDGTGFQFNQINVGYSNGNGQLGAAVPLTVDETVNGTVAFNFTGSDAIAPGTGSVYLIVQTNASNYMLGNLGVIDSSTDTETGYVPMAATPEPNSLVLLGSGLVGAAGMLFSRRRNAAGLL